eukprot:g9281.t1
MFYSSLRTPRFTRPIHSRLNHTPLNQSPGLRRVLQSEVIQDRVRTHTGGRFQICRALSQLSVVNGQDNVNEDDMEFDSIEAALAEIASGRFVVVLDDENRENEGDLIAAADLVSTESIAFMVNHTSGVICVGMLGSDLDRLQLPLMVPASQNTETKCTAFTVSVDIRHGISTGISAQDRARTIRALASSDTRPDDLRRPGHVFPLRYTSGGVLTRRGHTEASVDLARLAGCHPSGVLCEIVKKNDGSMARTPELFDFAKQHQLKIITIESLVEYFQNHSCV